MIKNLINKFESTYSLKDETIGMDQKAVKSTKNITAVRASVTRHLTTTS